MSSSLKAFIVLVLGTRRHSRRRGLKASLHPHPMSPWKWLLLLPHKGFAEWGRAEVGPPCCPRQITWSSWAWLLIYPSQDYFEDWIYKTQFPMGYRVSVRDEEKFWILMVVIGACSVNVLSAIGLYILKGTKWRILCTFCHTHKIYLPIWHIVGTQ